METPVGLVDVKSFPVHFYVQRSSSFATIGTVPWQTAALNIGNAMDLATGIFTAPRDGVYQFHFSGFGNSNAFYIYLRLNGYNVAYTYGHTNYDSASLQSRLQLKKGDTVNMFLAGGTLFDNADRYTSFTGWLDDEQLHL